MEQMLITYYDLQVQKGILHYQFKMPQNVEIYLTEAKNLTDFDALKPKIVMQMIGVEVDLGVLDTSKLSG